MSDFISKYVLCPFFKGTKKNTQDIICEGVKRNTSIHLTFYNKLQQKKYKEYMKELCCNNYNDCYIAKMLLQKYEEEQANE